MERVKGRSRKGSPSVIRGYGRFRRSLSVLACSCLVMTNVLGSAMVTYADSDDTGKDRVQEFRVSRDELQDAVRSAVKRSKPLDEDDFEFSGDESSSYEELLDADGTLYALRYHPDEDAGKLQLKTYVRLTEVPEEADSYLVSGEEEIIFVLLNDTDRELTGRICIGDSRSEDIVVAAKDFFEVEEEILNENTEEEIASEDAVGFEAEKVSSETETFSESERSAETENFDEDEVSVEAESSGGDEVSVEAESSDGDEVSVEAESSDGDEVSVEAENPDEGEVSAGTENSDGDEVSAGAENPDEGEVSGEPENSDEGEVSGEIEAPEITEDVENTGVSEKTEAAGRAEISGESAEKQGKESAGEEKRGETEVEILGKEAETADKAAEEKPAEDSEAPEVSVSLHRTFRVMAAATGSEAEETEVTVDMPEKATPEEAEVEYIEGEYFDSVLLNGKAAAAFAITLDALEEEGVVYRAETDNAVVEAVVSEDAFAVPVILTARALTADSAEYAGVAAQIAAQGYGAQKFTAYDICFVDEAGTEIEPDGEVKVSIYLSDADTADGLAEKAEETTLLHIHEERLTKLTDAVIEETEDGQAKAEFTTSEFSVFAFLAEEKPSMTVAVDGNAEVTEGVSYQTIQDAVNYIVAQQNAADASAEETEWLISVAEGTYARFLVPHGVKNITIQGCGESTVIETLSGSEIPNVEVLGNNPIHSSDGQGIIIWGADITLKDMKIVSGTETTAWYASAVGTQDIMWGSSEEADTPVVLENCIFEGSGAGFAFMPLRTSFTVKNCRISNYAQAIYFACDNFAADDCHITGNTIENCIFAVHGYYGVGAAENAMEISGNTISGTSDRFAVIAVLDQNNTGAVKLDITNNTFSYTIVGGINQRKEDGNPMEAVMSSNGNTFNDYSYVADAYWYSATDYGTTFYAPKQEGKIATWYGNPTTEAGQATQERIEAALEEYGTAGQVIEINAPAQETFTIGKNAIVIEQYVDAGNLQISKTVVGNNSDPTDFNFDVKFSRADGRVLNGCYDYIDGNGSLQTGKLADGVLTVTMKAGQTVTIKDLLPGTTYEITEHAHIKYTSEGTGTTGTIAAKETKTAEFTNTYLPEYADWDDGHSKSKTAAELEKQEDGTYTSEVTLSLPSAQENLATDVVFVLDESSAYPAVREEMHTMLEALVRQVQESGANVKVGLVEFRGIVETVELTPLTEETIETIIEAAGTRPPAGGSNMHAGLLEAKRMLEEDTDVENHRKYLILIGDGIAYTWWKDGGQAGVNFANADSPNSPMLASPDAWGVKYGYDSAPPADWEEHLAEVASLLEKTVNEKSSVYDRSNPTEGKPFIANAEKDGYATTTDLALFYSYQVYMQLQSKYNCFTVGRSAFTENPSDDPERRDWDVYPYGRSFMSFLQGDNEDVDFTAIQKEILYLLDAGSRVEDYMGYVDNDYNFDFVNDASALKMKAGEAELTAEKISDTAYGFGKTESGYQYILEYYPGDLKAEEHFIWTINVPVSNFAPVSLTYKVKLTNPKNAAGTYGQYDEDGSEALSGLYTNNSATLYPVDSNGEPSGDPEDFNKPTVEYTVEGSDTPDPGTTPDPTPGGDNDDGDDDDDDDKNDNNDDNDDNGSSSGGGHSHGGGSSSKSKTPTTTISSAETPLTNLTDTEVPAAPLEGLPKTGETPSFGPELMAVLAGMFYLLYTKWNRRKGDA